MQSNEIASIRWYFATTRFMTRKIFGRDRINTLVRDGVVPTKSRNVPWKNVPFTPTTTMSSRLITGSWRCARSPCSRKWLFRERKQRAKGRIIPDRIVFLKNIIYTISGSPLNNRANRENYLYFTLRYFGPYLRRSFSAKCDLLRFFDEYRTNS